MLHIAERRAVELTSCHAGTIEQECVVDGAALGGVDGLGVGEIDVLGDVLGRGGDPAVLAGDGDGACGADGFVGLTRGRSSNDAYVVTDDNTTALDILYEAISRSWADRPAIEIRAELDAQARQFEPGRSAPTLGR